MAKAKKVIVRRSPEEILAEMNALIEAEMRGEATSFTATEVTPDEGEEVEEGDHKIDGSAIAFFRDWK